MIRTTKVLFTSFALIAALLAFEGSSVMAQQVGLGSSKGSPVDIESDELEINEDKGTAMFTGRVVANQDKFRLRSASLEVFYKSEKKDEKSEQDGKATKITHMEALGSVVIITRTQKITGGKAFFDMLKDIVTVTGDVVVTQGQNVIKGQKLIVEQKTGKTRFVGGSSGQAGRVRGLFLPSKKK